MLELFSGLEGGAAPWRGAGDEVVTLDLDPRFGADHVRDILTVHSLPELERTGRFDFVWASPPCEAFSTGSMGHHFTGGWRAYVPRTEHARTSLRIVAHTFALLEDYGAPYVIENPRAVMRKITPRPPDATVTYCHYGDVAMKPTDLWVRGVDVAWRPLCHNQRPTHPADCCCHDHEGARRGAKTGTQGKKGAAARAVIPFELASVVRDAVL